MSVYSRDPIVSATIAAAFDPLDVTVFATVAKETRGVIYGYGPAKLVEGGVVFTATKQPQQLRVMKDSFGFFRYAPYPGWENFAFEARRAWDEFRYFVGVETAVGTIAVRFENHVDVPPAIPFSQYFTTYIAKSDAIPTLWEAFSLEIQAPIPDSAWTLRVRQASKPNTTVVTAEIDLRRPIPEGGDWWVLLQEARDLKNRVFDDLITSSFREELNRKQLQIGPGAQ